jgi:hypothetical protein
MQIVGTQTIKWLLPKIALCNVHVLFILWKWTYFHTLIIKNVKKKTKWNIHKKKLKGTANHYALFIHMGVSKKIMLKHGRGTPFGTLRTHS